MSKVQKIAFKGENSNLLERPGKNYLTTPQVSVQQQPMATQQPIVQTIQVPTDSAAKTAQTLAYVSTALALVSLGVAGAVSLKRGKSVDVADILDKTKRQVTESLDPALQKMEERLRNSAFDAARKAGEATAGIDKRFEDVFRVINEKAQWHDSAIDGVVKRQEEFEATMNNKLGTSLIDAVNSAVASKTNSKFFTREVTVDGMKMQLARVYNEVSGEADAQMSAELRSEAARRILGIVDRSDAVPPEHPVVRLLTSEVRPFAATGGLAAVPREVVSALSALMNTKQNATLILDTPAYVGKMNAKNWFSIERNADGTYSYMKAALDDNGVLQRKPMAKRMEKIHEFDTKMYTDNDIINEHVTMYMSEPMEVPVEFNLLKPRLDVDSRHMIADALKKGEKFENDLIRIEKNKKTGEIEATAKIKYAFYENDKFNMAAPANVKGDIYRSDTVNTFETERFVYLSKFFTEHIYNSKKSKIPQGADLIIGNDWHAGPAAAILKLLTIVKKHYGMDPEEARRIQNIPFIDVLHNAGEAGWSWHSQAKLLNEMFGEHTAKIVENAWKINTFIEGKAGGLTNDISNGLMQKTGINPQIMAATYADIISPVSTGYTNEIANTAVYGKTAHDIFKVRGRRYEFSDENILRKIAEQNGLNPDGFDIKKPTLVALPNGCDRANNIITENNAQILIDDLKIRTGEKFKVLTRGANPIEVHNHNKGIALRKVAEDIALAHEGKGNPMNIALPELTDLSGVDVNTPVFATAGRIVDQKGLDIFAQSIKEFYKDYKGTNYPVFYAQGVSANEEGMKFVQKLLDIKREIANVNPDAAKRIVFAELFSEPGRYDCCKLMSDFTIMSSWFEPFGLVHKEIAYFSGAIPVVTKTGGLMENLQEGVNALASEFSPKHEGFFPLEENARNFAIVVNKAVDWFTDKARFAKGINASYRARHDWLNKYGPADNYARLGIDLGVFDKSVMDYAHRGKIKNLYDGTERTYQVVNNHIGTNPPTAEERASRSWIRIGS